MREFFYFYNPFFIFGLVWAVFFGWRSVFIFVSEDEIKKKKKCKHWDWWLYQIIFNATGALIGWFALQYIWETNISVFKVEHFLALIIAFLGITGNLPFAALLGKIK